jgi:putative sterol carrier protein
MEYNNRINEIKEKGAETANKDDIPKALNLMVELVNTNPDIQKLVEGLSLTGVIELTDINETLNMSIDNGKASYGTGSISNPDFNFSGDLVTITKVLLGELDAVTAYFSEIVEAEGDLEQMITFMNVMEIGLDELNIVKKGEAKSIIPIATMKELLQAYTAGPEAIKAEHVPQFLNIMAAFINLNPEAQEEIEDSELRIALKFEDVGDFYITIENNKMSVSEQPFDEKASLELIMPLSTMTDVMFDGDAVSAYMAGQITVNGDLSQAMLFQSIMEMLIDKIEI